MVTSEIISMSSLLRHFNLPSRERETISRHWEEEKSSSKFADMMGYGDRSQEGKNPQVVQIDEYRYKKKQCHVLQQEGPIT